MNFKSTIIVHHGGYWQVVPTFKYIGGEVNTYDNLPSSIGASYIKELIASLGHKDIIKVHYQDPMLDLVNGCRILYDDSSFEPLLSHLSKGHPIHIYCEHLVDDEVMDLDKLDEGVSFTQMLGSPLHLSVQNVQANDIDYDEEGTDVDDDELVDARIQNRKAKVIDNEIEDELKRLEIELQRDRIDMDSYYEGYSDLDSPVESSEDEEYGYIAPPAVKEKRKRGNVYKTELGPREIVFHVNQIFDNAKQFKKAISEYCVSNGVDIYYTKNHKQRVGARCKTEGCEWRIWASEDAETTRFTVRTHFPEHSHGRQRVVRKISHQWVAQNYAAKFKANPYMKMHEIVSSVKLDWGIDISMYCAYKARKAAISLIVGEYKEQYSLLNEYADEIKKADPNNTVKFELENNVFRKMYIGFHALIQGFKVGCRPFISIDGCFLKGPYGGQLLVAVGRDGNNQMYPIAWAVVEIENTESWTWFLQLLADDLGTTNGAGYVVMSDQQKGLVNAVDDVFSQAEKRCCARHVYMNFREVFGGNVEYRRWFWRIAKSTTKVEFESNIDQLRQICPAAADDLLQRNYKKWCRAFFTPMSTCDNVDNNMSEVFNAYILKSRHKPIISMLEDIREALMERLPKKREFMATKNINICPRIQKQLEKAKLDSRGWSARWDGNWTFSVREGIDQERYVVDILNRTCSCNSWQLSGIPCNHVVAAIWPNEEPEKYVSRYYQKYYYLKAYELSVSNLRGSLQWEKSSRTKIEAPKLKKVKAGRPKTKRQKSVGEETNKRSRQGTQMKCFYCGMSGHNKKGCKLDSATKAQIQQHKQETEAQRKQKVLEKQQQSLAKKHQRQLSRQREGHNSTQIARGGNHIANATGRNQLTGAPIHQRGFGVYTYPNGFSRAASMQPHRRNIACYTDFDGQQTLQSMTSMQDTPPFVFSQSSSSSTLNPRFLDTRGRPCISGQRLQEHSHNAAFAKDQNRNLTNFNNA